ncbi:hypothetical protein HDF24_04170 [Mucilaginibacter sp. X4EP1]|uniref:glycosyl hydrolase family 79 C-terminal domain-containing protein n=1 Tax=Mucilaginibacter sp. X4EP1 TaxID=2723092 RepID=UPI002167AF4A|nr:glycosyl hydrolase family 79 C-terminal domain-containing protein [Mucilaginibacter sp. X4EP1]MCS3816640.1 hypothetical protein [Mucilaginibacter sp. X4EP1]
MNRKWLAIIILAISLTGCNKGDLEIKPPPGQAVAITVNVNGSTPGHSVSPAFEGLSYETGIFDENPDFLNENNTVFIQLIKNLGTGVLRIGGDSSDETTWTGNKRNSSTPANSLTTTDIDHLAAFSKAVGWPVIFGLNLGKFDADTAAKEAVYIDKTLKSNLYVLQSGNEPDVFKLKLRDPDYNFAKYQTEWNHYFSSVKKATSNVHFAGPDVTPFNPGWVSSFAGSEHGNIHLIDSHYYATGPASNASINYNNILTADPRLDSYLVQLSNISAKYRIPYRISECNSVFGGGKPGVSDTFASALWALDFMWTVAENNGQGVNFHGGPARFAYTPITMDNGQVTARPEYYAMLAFRYGAVGGKLIPATIFNPRDFNNCTTHACSYPDGSYAVTLINKDTESFSFTIQLDKTVNNILVYRLLAPTITSTTGTSFAGSGVNADGSFSPASSEQKTINGKSFVVNVPAGSAAVVLVK